VRYQVYNAVTHRALTGTDAPGSILEQTKVNVPNEYAHALPTDDAVRRRIRSQRFKARGGQLAAVEQQQLADVHDVPASVVNVDWGHGRVECVLKNDSGPGGCTSEHSNIKFDVCRAEPHSAHVHRQHARAHDRYR